MARTIHSTNSATLADILERVLDKGVVIAGDIKIKLVEIELLTIQIRLVVASVDKAKEIGLDWWTTERDFGSLGQSAVPQLEHKEQILFLEQRIADLEARLAEAETRSREAQAHTIDIEL